MIERQVQIDGVQQALEVFQRLPDAVLVATRMVTERMKLLTEGATPVGPPSSLHSGTLKHSWGRIESVSGGFSFTNPQLYAGILEEGLYPRVGRGPEPRTAPGIRRPGIFSRQAIDGIVWPILEDAASLSGLARVAVDQILKELSHA